MLHTREENVTFEFRTNQMAIEIYFVYVTFIDYVLDNTQGGLSYLSDIDKQLSISDSKTNHKRNAQAH